MSLYGLPEPAPEFATIKVRMLKTTRAIPYPGSPEVDYQEGCEYDLPEWLAEAFFRGGEGDPAEAHAQPETAPQEPVQSDGADAAQSSAAGAEVRLRTRQPRRRG